MKKSIKTTVRRYIMTLAKPKQSQLSSEEEFITPTYAAREFNTNIHKYRLPDHSHNPASIYNLIHDELMLDGNSRLNLATFVTTWMEPEACKLMTETFDKNMIDKDEYPQTAEIENRCVRMLSNLYHSPLTDDAAGCSTVGSSEAAMLAGMALKWKWRERMKARGKPTDKPNMIMGIDVQVCWEKFCRYWDVEDRLIPMEKGRYTITPEDVIERIDENTIGVVGILGTTFTGQYEPIKDLNDALEEFNKKTGWDVPLHVDAASGGFVAPFIQEDLLWDFRLKWVKSINVSGHKYGLVYPGVGWVLWRDWTELPEDLIFRVNYLGGEMPTFALNFSRPGNQVIAQYYNFLRLGHEGYKKIMQSLQDTAVDVAYRIAGLGPFELLSDGRDIPVFAFRVKKGNNFSVFDVSRLMRSRGWLIPAYTLPPNNESEAVLRIVIKEGFSRDMGNLLIEDFKRTLEYFEQNPEHQATKTTTKGKVRNYC